MVLTKILVGVAVAVVLGFGAWYGWRYSLGLYATAPVYQTSRGALDGYDPVAYFTTGAPAAGKAELTHEWNGATWHFASAENLAAFRQAPEKYAPQFGGYCAYAVANNYTAKVSPDAWHIEDGKLYLNFNLDVREAWRARKAEFIQSANRNWPAVIRD
ncbi:MAG: YHS domain-containing (seleno)protein [Gammaproteobacteria bacterium]